MVVVVGAGAEVADAAADADDDGDDGEEIPELPKSRLLQTRSSLCPNSCRYQIGLRLLSGPMKQRQQQHAPDGDQDAGDDDFVGSQTFAAADVVDYLSRPCDDGPNGADVVVAAVAVAPDAGDGNAGHSLDRNRASQPMVPINYHNYLSHWLTCY